MLSRPPSLYMTRYRSLPWAVGRRSIQVLGMRRSHALVAVGVPLYELEVVLGANHRTRVSRECHDREHSKNGVDGAALETQVA